MSQVKVLYFAGIKDIIKKESEELELPSNNTTLNTLSEILISKYGPKFQELLYNSMYAVNMEYVEKEKESSTVIQDQSEIAIIPPVSDSYYLVASSIAALVARFLTHPLDTIKTRLQTNHDTTYTPLIDNNDPTKRPPTALESFLSLYRGLGITLVFSVPALTLYLSTYEWAKSLLPFPTPLLKHTIAGCFAELAAGLFFTPMEVIKNQLQINHLETNTTWSLAKLIAREEGPVGFYRGYWITIAVFLPHTVVYFVAYEQLKTFWMVEEQTFLVYLWCSAVASALGIIVSTPIDIVKTRWQVSAQEVAFQGGPVEIAKMMWINEGKWRAFFQGMMARIAWGIPATTINMAVFEQLIKLHNNS